MNAAIVVTLLPLLFDGTHLGLAVAVALRSWHDTILSDAGAWFIGVFAAVSLLAAWSGQRRARRTRARDEDCRRGVVRAGRSDL